MQALAAAQQAAADANASRPRRRPPNALLAHGIERLHAVDALAAFCDTPYYPHEVATDIMAPVGESVIIGSGPGRLLLATSRSPDVPWTSDCEAWVFNEANRTVVHRAPTVWRFVRDSLALR